jgi:hypothetical protein
MHTEGTRLRPRDIMETRCCRSFRLPPGGTSTHRSAVPSRGDSCTRSLNGRTASPRCTRFAYTSRCASRIAATRLRDSLNWSDPKSLPMRHSWSRAISTTGGEALTTVFVGPEAFRKSTQPQPAGRPARFRRCGRYCGSTGSTFATSAIDRWRSVGAPGRGFRITFHSRVNWHHDRSARICRKSANVRLVPSAPPTTRDRRAAGWKTVRT